MDELNRRNTNTAEIAIKDLYVKVYEMLDSIKKQQECLSAIMERIYSLELQVNLQRVRLTGHGPSVK